MFTAAVQVQAARRPLALHKWHASRNLGHVNMLRPVSLATAQHSRPLLRRAISRNLSM